MALNLKINSSTFTALLKPDNYDSQIQELNNKMTNHIKPSPHISTNTKSYLQQQRKQEAKHQYQLLQEEIERLKEEVRQLRQDNLALVEELRQSKPAIANPKR